MLVSLSVCGEEAASRARGSNTLSHTRVTSGQVLVPDTLGKAFARDASSSITIASLKILIFVHYLLS